MGILEVMLRSHVTVANHGWNRLYVLCTAVDGYVYKAIWQADTLTTPGWRYMVKGKTYPGTPLSEAHRSPDYLDFFMIGLDGRVLTSAWQEGESEWNRWTPIKDLKTLPGATASAVSRSGNELDISAIRVDGYIYTAAREPGDAAWRGCWRMKDGRAATGAPGASMSVVTWSADELDISVQGLHKLVYTAACELGMPQWQGWWRVGWLISEHTLHDLERREYWRKW